MPLGEKIPGTYCPLCGEIGLVKVVYQGAEWAICPMKDGEAVIDSPKDAHTGYVLTTKASAPARAAKVEEPKASPMGDSTKDEEIDNG